MRYVGFSTGALAFSDFKLGIQLQRNHDVKAVELSALREPELAPLINVLPSLNLEQFDYRSFHAPSGLEDLSSAELANALKPIAEFGLPIVVHPDVISGEALESWSALGECLLVENMDTRKRVGRTADELSDFFDLLPKARFCCDIAHARQVDSTMSVAAEMLSRFANRLAEIHISEVNWECKHQKISSISAVAFQRIAGLIPHNIPVIIESVIEASQIEAELEIVHRCLNRDTPLFAATSEIDRAIG